MDSGYTFIYCYRYKVKDYIVEKVWDFFSMI